MPETPGLRRFPRIQTARTGLASCLLAALMFPWPGPADASPILTCPTPATDPGKLPPCGAGSALGPARDADLDTGISNPIHRITGEKFLREIDLPAPLDDGHPGLTRLYRSGARSAGPLGAGWASEYEAALVRGPTGWQLRLADGRVARYDAAGNPLRAGDGRILAAPAQSPTPAPSPRPRPSDDTLAAWLPATGHPAPSRHTARLWSAPGGQRLEFDARGRLLAILKPGRASTRIDYHPDGPFQGLIAHIRTGERHLTLRYARHGDHRLLQSMETPLGIFRYEYDIPTVPSGGGAARSAAPRLIRVHRPDGMQRRYHYEPSRQAGRPTAITGVTLQDRAGRTQRMRSWAYDADGRVIQAIPGPPGQTAGRLDLNYPLESPAAVERDARGRLTAIGELRIERAPDGPLRRLKQTRGGWPGLVMDYDAQGRRSAWDSALTGRTQLRYDVQGRLQALTHANGDHMTLQRDAAGRPRRLHYAGNDKAGLPVALDWHGRHLRRLDHPAETETLVTGPNGRLRARSIRRPHPSGPLSYQETFAYDDMGRLLRHSLPEGGVLHTAWSPDGRLNSLTWEAADGSRHPVIGTTTGQAGYRYGNGLQLRSGADGRGRADRLMVSDGPRILWAEHRLHDTDGRVLRHTVQAPDRHAQRRYAYDARHRVIGIQETDGPGGARIRHWLAWAPDGSLIGRDTHDATPEPPAHARSLPGLPDPTPLPPIRRDAAGLPLRIGDRALRHQAQQRLAEVRQGDQVLVRYTYNARGQQIRQQSGGQVIERYYLDNRLAARWTRPVTPAGTAAPRFGISERYLYAQDVPVGLLRTDPQGRTRLFFIHADLLGAPVMITDGTRAVRWLADYDTLGRATRLAGDLDLPLRRPGQDEDPFTGWHDNVFRTYLPKRGHYLEPDPLGPAPGLQALGYAAQQPLRHIDPLGLILLAFDGTRYSRANQSNVWKLAQAYADGPAYYHAGPGSSLYADWDAVTAASSGQILRNQWQSLMNALQRVQGAAAPVPIDLLGYSRGAALAREFANRIARQTRNGWFSYDDPLRGTIGLCVDLRFLGLFDTVAQFGLLGAANAGFDLSIAGAWGWVAHAVALHELRSLFPLVSADEGSPANTVEAPFIGAHADIGGGLLLDDHGQPQADGDLSDVALNWMRWQALAALVPMKDLTAGDQQVSRPWLHDERSPGQRLLGGDRDLQDASTRSRGPQGADARLGAAQRQAFEAFIQRISLWELNAGAIVGQVDMQGYGAWLEAQLGLPGMR
ncbi:phospholipase effector Tle1 domain-containing protein [Castellaniella sp.]|uniref:phospholipase effector Tle1 domain-containing protein n=1 Tax=Castellaniella sp. TaxID=1955812 RepID=UPI003C794BC7